MSPFKVYPVVCRSARNTALASEKFGVTARCQKLVTEGTSAIEQSSHVSGLLHTLKTQLMAW